MHLLISCYKLETIVKDLPDPVLGAVLVLSVE